MRPRGISIYESILNHSRTPIIDLLEHSLHSNPPPNPPVPTTVYHTFSSNTFLVYMISVLIQIQNVTRYVMHEEIPKVPRCVQAVNLVFTSLPVIFSVNFISFIPNQPLDDKTGSQM
jgi:hypothetical protein